VPFELDGEVFEIQISLAQRQHGRGAVLAQQQHLSNVGAMEL
jgi:hypothetical protein